MPILLARWPLGSRWRAILRAYALWGALLLAFGLSSGGTWGERLGRPLIPGMFLTIPVLVLGLRIAGVR